MQKEISASKALNSELKSWSVQLFSAITRHLKMKFSTSNLHLNHIHFYFIMVYVGYKRNAIFFNFVEVTVDNSLVPLE